MLREQIPEMRRPYRMAMGPLDERAMFIDDSIDVHVLEMCQC